MADDNEFREIHVTPAPIDNEPANGAGDPPLVEVVEPVEGQTEGDPNAEKPPVEGTEAETDENGNPVLPKDAPKPKKGAEARIGELTRQRRQAERDAEYWKGIATQRNGATSGDDAAPTSEPDPDDFPDYNEYVKAAGRWAYLDEQRKTADTNATKAAESAQTHREAEWGAKLDAVKTIHADFDAVMEAAETPTAQHVAQAIFDADRGAELLYHLAQNPDLVEQLNEMSPYRAAMELGRIEDTLPASAKAPPAPLRETKQSRAPAPITPIPNASTTTKDPSNMNMDEYKAYRKKNGIG